MSSPKKTKKPKRKKGKKSKEPSPPKEPSFPVVTIKKSSTGFTVRKNPEYNKELEMFDVSVAYNTVRGSPFSRYDKMDFSFGNNVLQVESSGLKIVEKEDNRLLCEITDEDFDLSVNGFDENRDVFVKVLKK
jgi:hypothetical protein